MKVIRRTEGTMYEAPKHSNVWSSRKIGLPNGGVEMSGSPTEKMYYILSGAMLVRTESETVTLQAGDIVYFKANEEREIRVAGNEVCTILVCIVKV
jgi:quercetin dioxygenase-like cupin family protein